jgi:hypothetical protein
MKLRTKERETKLNNILKDISWSIVKLRQESSLNKKTIGGNGQPAMLK